MHASSHTYYHPASSLSMYFTKCLLVVSLYRNTMPSYQLSVHFTDTTNPTSSVGAGDSIRRSIL